MSEPNLSLFEETTYLQDLLAIEQDFPACVDTSCCGWGLRCLEPELAGLFDRRVETSEKVYDATEIYESCDLPVDAPRPSGPDHFYELTPKNGLLLCLENEDGFSSWVLLREKGYIFFRLLTPNLYHATLEWDQGGWRVGQLIETLRARQKDEGRPPRFQGALSMGRLFVPSYQNGRIAWDSSQVKAWAAVGTAIAIQCETPPFSEKAQTEVVALVARPSLTHLFLMAPGVLEAAQMVVEDALTAGLSHLPFSVRPALAFLRREIAITLRLLQEEGKSEQNVD